MSPKPRASWRPSDFAGKAGSQLRCLLCPRSCVLEEGDWGECGTRTRQGDQIWTTVYGLVSHTAVDHYGFRPVNFLFGSVIFLFQVFGLAQVPDQARADITHRIESRFGIQYHQHNFGIH